MSSDFDIAISGAGPVGLALALLLAKRGVDPKRIVLADARTVEQAAQDPRSIALSHGSRQILEEIAGWPQAVTAIHQIHVSRRGHFGRTLIDRADYGLPALGYVCRYGNLVTALAEATQQAGIVQMRPAEVRSLEESDDDITLQLADGSSISAGIAAMAEGGLFAEQPGKTQQRDYEQTAIVAHVRSSAPIAQRAYERFTDQGPLALLPQDDGYALVWCVRPANAEQLIGLSDSAFLAALEQAFGSRLGRFISASPRKWFPLGLNAQAASTARSVTVGNAAQTLHPVAGQGLNLGLRDAMVLANLLAQKASPAMLQKFVGARQSDRKVTIQLTDLMARVFASAPEGTLTQALLGMSLGIVDGLKPAKRVLAEQMMYGWR